MVWCMILEPPHPSLWSSKLSWWTSQILSKMQQAVTNVIMSSIFTSFRLRSGCHLPLNLPKAYSITTWALFNLELNFSSFTLSPTQDKASLALAAGGTLDPPRWQKDTPPIIGTVFGASIPDCPIVNTSKFEKIRASCLPSWLPT